MRLNFGSNKKRVEGYTNIDIQNLENVDVVHDLTTFPYPFEDNSVDEILMQEFLEHVDVKYALGILKECMRLLKPDGTITIQVPDIEAMCHMIDKQCVCVPRKADRYEDYKADPKCWECGGKGMIHPERWHVAFTGAQKHPYDYHKNHFTFKYLRFLLERAGFTDLNRTENIYKLVLTARKPYDNK